MFGHHHAKEKKHLTANASIKSLEELDRFISTLLSNISNEKNQNSLGNFVYALGQKYTMITDQFEHSHAPFLALLEELLKPNNSETLENTIAKLNAMLTNNMQNPTALTQLNTFFHSLIDNNIDNKKHAEKARHLATVFCKNYLSKIKKLNSSKKSFSSIYEHVQVNKNDLLNIKQELAAIIKAKNSTSNYRIDNAGILGKLDNFYQLSLCEAALNNAADIQYKQIFDDAHELSIKCAKNKSKTIVEKITSAEQFIKRNLTGLTFVVDYPIANQYLQQIYNPLIAFCDRLSTQAQQASLALPAEIHDFLTLAVLETKKDIKTKFDKQGKNMLPFMREAYQDRLNHINLLVLFSKKFIDNEIILTESEQLLFKKIAIKYNEIKLKICDHPVLNKFISTRKIKKIEQDFKELNPLEKSKLYRKYADRNQIKNAQEVIAELKTRLELGGKLNANDDKKTLKIIDEINQLDELNGLLDKVVKEKEWNSNIESKQMGIEDELFKLCEEIMENRALTLNTIPNTAPDTKTTSTEQVHQWNLRKDKTRSKVSRRRSTGETHRPEEILVQSPSPIHQNDDIFKDNDNKTATNTTPRRVFFPRINPSTITESNSTGESSAFSTNTASTNTISSSAANTDASTDTISSSASMSSEKPETRKKSLPLQRSTSVQLKHSSLYENMEEKNDIIDKGDDKRKHRDIRIGKRKK